MITISELRKRINELSIMQRSALIEDIIRILYEVREGEAVDDDPIAPPPGTLNMERSWSQDEIEQIAARIEETIPLRQ